ncbi:TonB-dependent receptor [Lentimicrobium sp. S6]|uniref:TonB-dependent receptor n=3 Tax=unclassified Lentimicrobium TaxID=2677434 RepID=UPI0015551008|nr:TonB-dependent receptor [Lentimicrobium sp. S6]NPD45994.1 TonB-dependent receptor [Lentimicrobium sp. S6]
MFKQLLVILGIIAPMVLFSQIKMSGQVADDESGAPLVGAHIQINGIQSFQMVTDNRGAFAFNNIATGTYEVKVSFVGYQTYKETLELADDSHISVNLKEGLVGEEVVVFANRVSDNAPSAFQNLNKAEINNRNNGQDLPFILNNSPSLVATSDAGNGIGYSGFRIRGSDMTRINITMNGVPMNDAESHSVYFVDLPDLASSLDNIQIQRGVGTSTNGAGAFGASINMQTTTLNDQPYAKYDGRIGSYNSMKNTVSFGTGLLKNNLAFDGRLSKVHSDGYIDRASADLKSLYFSGGYYGEKDVLKFMILTGKEVTYQAWGGMPKASLDTNRTYNPYTYDNEVDDYQQDYYQLHYTHSFTDKLGFNATAFYTRGKGFYEQSKEGRKFEDYLLDDVVIGGDTITRTDLIQRKWLDNHYYGANLSLNYQDRKLEANIGAGWNQYDGDHYGQVIWSQYASNGDIRHQWYDNNGLKTDFNIYGKASYMITPSLSAFGDLQYRHIDYKIKGTHDDLRDISQNHDFNFINPKVGITGHIGNLMKVYGSFAIANREPSRSNYKDADEGYNPKPEQLQDIEAGMRVNSQAFAFNVNFFYMNYKDQLVATGKINGVGEAIMTNVPKSYRMGIEISGGAQIIDPLRWDFNLALSKNKIKDFTMFIDNWDTWGQEEVALGETNLILSPNTIANSIITYSPFKNFDMQWVAKYVSRQYIDNTSYEYNSIDPYFVNDLKFSYGFSTSFFKTIRLHLDVQNVLSEKYESYAWVYNYQYGGERDVIDGYFPMAPINVMGGITIEF